MNDQSSAPRRMVTAGAIGNVLEWYDFAIYGYFAPILGQQFFPSEDPVASILAAFGAFAAGYFTRPLGGVLLGHVGDTVGRRRMLALSVTLMGVATFLIGVLPSYATIGAAGSVLLVLLRLLQGLSVGGEYTGSVVYLVERAPPNRRGLIGSWIGFGSLAGFLLGSGTAAILEAVLSAEAVAAWGWRIPFLLGIMIGVLGLGLRQSGLEEESVVAEPSGRSPALAALRFEWPTMLQLGGVVLMVNAGFYMMFVYITTYLTQTVGLSASQAFNINTLSMVLLLVMIPVGGALSDWLGRKPVLLTASLGTLALSYPLMRLIHHEQAALILVGQCGFALLFGLAFGTNPTAMVEMTNARRRCSVTSIGYNLALALFGGTTPLVAAYLIEKSHDDLSPAYYLMILAAVSSVVIFTLRETANRPLSGSRTAQ